jgi:hypothetical protein
MAAHLGRSLEPWELVHHKDGNKMNNVIENLEIKTWPEHTILHHTGTRRSLEAIRSVTAFAQMREALKQERRVNAELRAALQSALIRLEYLNSEETGRCAATENARAALANANAKGAA